MLADLFPVTDKAARLKSKKALLCGVGLVRYKFVALGSGRNTELRSSSLGLVRTITEAKASDVEALHLPRSTVLCWERIGRASLAVTAIDSQA